MIGVFIGGAQAALWLLGRELGVPSASAPFLLALGLWLTGGLHLDRVMDTGDGLASRPAAWPPWPTAASVPVAWWLD